MNKEGVAADIREAGAEIAVALEIKHSMVDATMEEEHAKTYPTKIMFTNHVV